jgi:crotonobetainyl-CoA:carnitine CoA-transferase CaiB-like acyl-CoA transferase
LIYAAPDLIADEHIRYRKAIEHHHVSGVGELPMMAPMPRFSRTRTTVRWVAQAHGAETEAVLRTVCSLDDAEIASLAADGVISLSTND